MTGSIDPTLLTAGAARAAWETLVAAAPKIGRNDPCPCGSGKKFKKCCWDKALTPPPRPRAEALFEQAMDGVEVVFDFLRALPRRHPEAVEVRRHLDDGQDRHAAGEPGGLPDSQHVTEALFDFVTTRGGQTMGELFLARKGAKLDDATRLAVERLCASYPAFYVLEALHPGAQHKQLREVGTGAVWLVRDVDDPLAEAGEPGDVWLTRLVGGPEEAVMAMSPLVYPPASLAQHEAIIREVMASVGPLDLPAPAALALAMKRSGELVATYIVATGPDDEDPEEDDDEDR